MLYVFAGDRAECKEKYPNLITNVDRYFDLNSEPHWINNSLSKEMILDIDKSVVISDKSIDSPILGIIPLQMLSGGVKALMLMAQNDDDIVVWSTVCGNNCGKWILKIAKEKDLIICMSRLLILGEPDDPIDVTVVNTEKHFNIIRDFDLEIMGLLRGLIK